MSELNKRRRRSTPCRFSRLILCAVAGLAFLVAPTMLQAQWTQTWADDFQGPAGSAPDPSKWTYDLGTNFGDGEIQTATDSRANSYLDGNGNLKIAMLYDKATNSYTAARLKTAGLYAAGPYGRIEARIQNPYAQGVGAAFWALGNDYVTQNVPWPWAGEMDIMEITSNTPGHNGGTLHGGETDSQTNYEYGGISGSIDLPNGQKFSDGFHIFAIQWAPFHVQFFMDGKLYHEVYLSSLGATDVWAFNQPFYLILSAGIGAGNSGQPNGLGFPTYMTVDYVHVSQWSAGAPAAPGQVSVSNVTSNAATLNWAASSTPDVTYNIYASKNANFTPSLDTLVVQNLSNTSYTQTGLAAGASYTYKVVASNFGGESAISEASLATQAPGNSSGVKLSAGGYAVGNYMASQYVLGGNTNYHPATQIDLSAVSNPAPEQVYQTERWGTAAWTITNLNPSAVYNVRLHFSETAHTAPLQRAFDVSVNSQTVLHNFDIFQAAGAQNKAVVESFYTKADENGIIEIQTNYGTLSGAGIDLNPTINAIEVNPSSTGDNLVGATPGTTKNLSINSGGEAAAPFIADQGFNGGVAATNTNSVSTAGVTNAAPAAVYNSQRYVPFTYVLTGLVANATYDVRLHFAETYWTAAGKRIFNVDLNGNRVLSDFDIFATAGKDKAVVKDFSAEADMYGQIIVQLIYGGQDQPTINGLEAIQTSSTCMAPGAPGDLRGNATSTSQINLSWQASQSSCPVTYAVFRGTDFGVVPSASNRVASGLTSPSYNDTGLNASTTYHYVVTAVNSAGSTVSQETNATTADNGCTSNCGGGNNSIVAYNGGGPTVGNFVADAYVNSGGAAATAATIDTTGVTNPAPQAVYQTEHVGNTFTYTIPVFVAGSTHTIRLHFAEFYFSMPGQRVFNVAINGAPVLSNFDIVATAGASFKALVEQFSAVADGNGRIAITFTSTVDQAKISGIEIQ